MSAKTTTAIELLRDRDECKQSREEERKSFTHCLMCKARIKSKQRYCFECSRTLDELPDLRSPATIKPVEGKDYIVQTKYHVDLIAPHEIPIQH